MTRSDAFSDAHTHAELRWLIRMRWIPVAALFIAAALTWRLTDETRLPVLYALSGAFVAAYNVVFRVLTSSAATQGGPTPTLILAWNQILFDLVALNVLAVNTGGVASPVIWIVALHMVIASLLLPPRHAFGCFAVAVLLQFGGLSLTGQLPETTSDALLVGSWLVLLIATIVLVNHITKVLRLQRGELRRESRRRQAILETAVDGIIMIDDKGTIQSVNPASEHMFGYRLDELIGRNVSMLMPEPDLSRHDGYLEQYLATHKAKIIGIGREVRGRRKDGSEFPIDLAVSEVRIDDGVFFTGILRDITRRKEAEDELARLYKELQRHQEVMVQQEKMAAIGQMAAGVAHEISNPLAGMSSLVQLVKRRPERLDEDTCTKLDGLINRIAVIVRQLTEFSHPHGHEIETIDVNTLVEEALDFLRFDRRLRTVAIDKQLSPTPITARWAPQAMHQILLNLIGNALDAMNECESPRLAIRTSADNGVASIEIEDNGHGISKEDLSRVFDPFFTTKPVGRGTGLGLSISYRLAQSHGGRIDVESQVGKGTRFNVLLPLSCDREQSRLPVPGNEKPVISNDDPVG